MMKVEMSERMKIEKYKLDFDNVINGSVFWAYGFDLYVSNPGEFCCRETIFFYNG